jgi:hypothetical protein
MQLGWGFQLVRTKTDKKSAPLSQVARLPAYAWRRLHEGNIIAEVTSQPGIGVWRASAYRVSGATNEIAYKGQPFTVLAEAHQCADELARHEFKHECRVGTCGRWLRWPAKNSDVG